MNYNVREDKETRGKSGEFLSKMETARGTDDTMTGWQSKLWHDSRGIRKQGTHFN